MVFIKSALNNNSDVKQQVFTTSCFSLYSQMIQSGGSRLTLIDRRKHLWRVMVATTAALWMELLLLWHCDSIRMGSHRGLSFELFRFDKHGIGSRLHLFIWHPIVCRHWHSTDTPLNPMFTISACCRNVVESYFIGHDDSRARVKLL